MSRADFYRELVQDVENLVIAGHSAASAMISIALQDDDVDGTILNTWVMKKHESEAALEAWGRREADRAQFIVIAEKEIEKCKKRKGPYAQLGLLGLGAEEAIANSIGVSIGRGLTDHEIWKIEELSNPWLSELKLAHKAKVKSLRKLSVGD